MTKEKNELLTLGHVNFLTKLKREIRYRINLYILWPWQSLIRGYSDCDLWQLDYHLAKLIIKRLKAFKAMERNGYPSDLPSCKCHANDNGKDDEYVAEWERNLNKMIDAFDIVLHNYGLECAGSVSKTEKTNILGIEVPKLNMHMVRHYEEKYSEGMVLFAKYFRNLWD